MTMLRHNAGKTPLSLIPTSFFEAIFNVAFEAGNVQPMKLFWQVGQVLEFGAQKYSAHNWRKGGSWSSVLNSGLRHLVKLVEGEQLDLESGLSHTGHLGCNIAFLLEFATTGVGDDDTYKIPDFPFPVLVTEPAPGLVWVLNHLLKFRDTGEIDELRQAAYQLARYVEFFVPAAAAPIIPAEPVVEDWRTSALIDIRNGMSLGTVAARYGRSEAAIRKLITASALAPPADPSWHEQAIEAFREGGSVEQISQMFGRSPAAVQELLHRAAYAAGGILSELPFRFPSFGQLKSDDIKITRH